MIERHVNSWWFRRPLIWSIWWWLWFSKQFTPSFALTTSCSNFIHVGHFPRVFTLHQGRGRTWRINCLINSPLPTSSVLLTLCGITALRYPKHIWFCLFQHYNGIDQYWSVLTINEWTNTSDLLLQICTANEQTRLWLTYRPAADLLLYQAARDLMGFQYCCRMLEKFNF